MTTATALFMLPTAVIFPALLREANSPPASVTLRRKNPPPRTEKHHDRQWHDLIGRSSNALHLDDVLDQESEDSEEVLNAGGVALAVGPRFSTSSIVYDTW